MINLRYGLQQEIEKYLSAFYNAKWVTFENKMMRQQFIDFWLNNEVYCLLFQKNGKQRLKSDLYSVWILGHEFESMEIPTRGKKLTKKEQKIHDNDFDKKKIEFYKQLNFTKKQIKEVKEEIKRKRKLEKYNKKIREAERKKYLEFREDYIKQLKNNI